MILNIIVSSIIFGLSFVLAYNGIPFVVKAAHRLNLFDLPNNRKVHEQPVPRLGGFSFLPVVLVVISIIVVLVLRMSSRNVSLWTSASVQHFLAYLAGAVLLFGVGAYDDLLEVGYKKKFLVQIVSSALLCVSGLWIASFDNVFWINNVPFWIGMPLTILFVVYVTNAINLIDGIDGLSSGLSIISLLVISLINLLAGNLFWAFVSIAWLGAVSAFFYYNVFSKKNKIFMGDAGSLTLGYSIAFLVLHFWQVQPIECAHIEKPNMVVASTLIIPLFDVVRVFLSRIRDGRSPFLPDKNHIHHKLLRTGLSKRTTLLLLCAMSGVFICVNYFMALHISETLMLAADIVLYVVMQYIINFFINRKERREGIAYDRRLVVVIGLFGLLTMQSCISDDLNLRRERVIAIGIGEEGLNLPGTSSFDIPLSQLIEISEESELTVDSLTGDYLFYKMGDDMDSTVISIGQGSICDATEEQISVSLFADTVAVLTPNKRFPEFATLDFECTLVPQFEGDILKEGICDLEYIKTTLSIDIECMIEGLNGVEYLDQIEYEVPSFYDLEDPSELIEKNVPVVGLHRHEIHVKGINFRPEHLREGESIGIIRIDDLQLFDFHGAVRIKGKAKNVNIEDFQQSHNPMFHSRVVMGSMGTTEVTGHFREREIIDFPPMEFHDLPEFIQDEEVEIDIENPICRLSLNSEVPANVNMSAEIIGIKGEEVISHLRVGKDFDTEPILFEGATMGTMRRTNIWISRIPVENLPDTVDQNIVIPEIADIMRRIPDRFNILLTACTDSAQLVTLSLSEEYKAIPRYELVAPLKMGPNMKIVYTKELEELGSKIEHLDFSSLTLTAKVLNHLPLNIEIQAVAYDAQGEELSEVKIDKPALIPAFETSDIRFSLSCPSNDAYLKRIDKVELKILASSSEELAGISLNKNQNLRMEEVTISVK